MTTIDSVEQFLAAKPELGLSPAMYAAEKAAAAGLCPQLEFIYTHDQLDPDPREKAVERVLEVAGDHGFAVDLVVEILRGFRMDLTAAEVRDEMYQLLDLAAEVRRANLAGRTAVEEMFAERYANQLTYLAGGAR